MRKTIRFILGFLLCSMFFIGCSSSNTENMITDEINNKGVSICFINSGKSDSILVKAFDKAYLIDTGTKDSVDAIKDALEFNNVYSLDAIFLTHTHKDHLGGLKKLSQDYDIPVVYSAEISKNESDGINKIDELVDEKLELNHQKLKALDKVYITDNVYFEVLGPITYNDDDDNDNSLVLRLSVYGKTAIFAGDMQFAEEQSLMDKGIDLKADILKVGNHGNKDATSKDFAEAVSPKVAVITTNREVDSGTASKRVKKLFKNSDLYITDEYDRGFLVIIDADGSINTVSE